MNEVALEDIQSVELLAPLCLGALVALASQWCTHGIVLAFWATDHTLVGVNDPSGSGCDGVDCFFLLSELLRNGGMAEIDVDGTADVLGTANATSGDDVQVGDLTLF